MPHFSHQAASTSQVSGRKWKPTIYPDPTTYTMTYTGMTIYPDLTCVPTCTPHPDVNVPSVTFFVSYPYAKWCTLTVTYHALSTNTTDADRSTITIFLCRITPTPLLQGNWRHTTRTFTTTVRTVQHAVAGSHCLQICSETLVGGGSNPPIGAPFAGYFVSMIIKLENAIDYRHRPHLGSYQTLF